MSNADTIDGPATVDITSAAFARRFGALLRERRRSTGRSVRDLARDGVLDARMLRRIEDAAQPLDAPLVETVAALYGADLVTITPVRLGLAIGDGVIESGTASRSFTVGDDDSLLRSYLALVRSLRRDRDAVVVLRRDDIESLAAAMRTDVTAVLERLLQIMGSTRAQRSAVMALFATGVMVIGLVSSAAAAGNSDSDRPDTPDTVELGSTAIVEGTIVGDTVDTVSTTGTIAPVTVPPITVPPTTPSPTTVEPAPTTAAPAPVTTAPRPVTTTVPAPPTTGTVVPPTLAPPPTQDVAPPPIPGG